MGEISMSSTHAVTARRDKGRYREPEKHYSQTESGGSLRTLDELYEINDIIIKHPITVENSKLLIDSNHLDIGRIYRFEYLDSQMVLWKNADNSVDMYEIVE